MTLINPGPVNLIKRPTLSRSILNPEATALPTILDDKVKIYVVEEKVEEKRQMQSN